MIRDRDPPNLHVHHWTTVNMELIKRRADGTTFAEISKKIFRPIPALVPNKPMLEAFMATRRLRGARVRINPDVPDNAIEDACGKSRGR